MPSDDENFEESVGIMAQYNKDMNDLENKDDIVEGEETVNGISCYKIRMDIDDIVSFMAECGIDDNLVSSWESAYVTYYISKSDGHMVKSIEDIKVTFKSGDLVEFNDILIFKNINEVQDIELPEEAENAIDMSSLY